MTGASGGVVVIGLGNGYRRDDGAGVAAAAALDDLAIPNVVVKTGITDPMSLLEAWTDASLAVIIDAAIVSPSTPGRVRRFGLSDVSVEHDGLSSHSIGIVRAHALGQALGRVPGKVVVFSIEVADTGHGSGLTPRVAGAVPEVVRVVAAEIERMW